MLSSRARAGGKSQGSFQIAQGQPRAAWRKAGTAAGEAASPGPTQPLRPGLTMRGGPAAIAGCPPSQVRQGLAPSSRGVRLTPRHSEPREDGGLGPQCSAFSFACSGVRAEPQRPGLGQGFWKGLWEAEGKAMGFGTQRWQSMEAEPRGGSFPEPQALP